MFLFIDTNIFLSFYHLTSEDLTELEKLVVLIKNKEIRLLVTQQIVDETIRNRATKIKSSFSPFTNEKIKLSFPSYSKDYPEYQELKEALNDLDKKHSQLVVKIKADIEEKKLKADLLLKELFEIAEILTVTPEVISKAKERVALGNPPGKNGSLGDAVNWEILSSYSEWPIKLSFISDDKDYYCPLNNSKFNEFLDKEWEGAKRGKILFYRQLSSFFKEHFPKIDLKAEGEKDFLIEKLSASFNFAETHNLIAKLSNYSGFTYKQAEDLVSAVLNNNQIRWVLSDDDVFGFYKNLDDTIFLALHEKYDEFATALKSAAKERAVQPP